MGTIEGELFGRDGIFGGIRGKARWAEIKNAEIMREKIRGKPEIMRNCEVIFKAKKN